MGLLTKTESITQTWAMRLDSFLRFIPRLTIGAIFIPAGWGKLMSMSRTIDYFQTLNIPLATVQAPIVALLELACGFLIVVGLFTRSACLPLIAILTVAAMTAHKSEFSSLLSFAQTNVGLILVILICTFSLGSGSISLDQLFLRRK